MAAAAFVRELKRSPALQGALNRYLFVTLSHLVQTAACTRGRYSLHSSPGPFCTLAHPRERAAECCSYSATHESHRSPEALFEAQVSRYPGGPGGDRTGEPLPRGSHRAAI